nr:MAG TPA: hypothetical protein [Crassvirales sp.]
MILHIKSKSFKNMGFYSTCILQTSYCKYL